MRGYTPRASTVDLMALVLARPGIAQVRPIAPGRSGRPTRLRITLTSRDGTGRQIYTDMTLAETRTWLTADAAADTTKDTPR